MKTFASEELWFNPNENAKVHSIANVQKMRLNVSCLIFLVQKTKF